MTRAASIHPEHAIEQAYIERVSRAEEHSRANAATAAEFAPDKTAARILRDRALERLRETVDPEALVFGRIDLDDGPTLYLGRGAIHEDAKLLVINWRMDVAAPFYTATMQDPEGLALRRRFQLDQLRLLGIVDDRFVAGDVVPVAVSADDEELAEDAEVRVEPHLVDAILADMDRARGTEMRDIVATIEAQQYKLISDGIDGLLVIQGGPGSGKTAIALHRAAMLLFRHRDDLERSGVLVVGPNRAFMEYVKQVLPALGESSVEQKWIDRVHDLEDVRVRGIETGDVARLKGDLRIAAVLQRAVSARVRAPEDDLEVAVARTRATLPAADIASAIELARRGDLSYINARDQFRRALVEMVRASVATGRGLLRSGPDAAEIEMAVTGAGGPLDRIWPTVTAPEVLRDLFNSRQRLDSTGQGILTENERALLQRGRERLLRDEPWTVGDVPLLDEIDMLLRGGRSSYGYVLVDEAQDLTPMQIRMVLRRTADGRATLVGDIAQSTGAWRYSDWTELLTAAAVDAEPRIAELGIGYRVPRQIMDFAGELLPRVAPDITVPMAVREGAENPRLVKVEETALVSALAAETERRSDGDRIVGLIAPADVIDQARVALAEAGLETGDVLTDGLSRQLTLLTAAQAKGLEFDHVIVLDPAGIAGSAEDWVHVYIALTRATRTLTVIYSTEEPLEARTQPVIESPADATTEARTSVTVRSGPFLGARFTEALMNAKFLHSAQSRRGTAVPYFAHLQAVSALVLEDGGSEDEAIAALLHDAVEDHGPEVLDRIAYQFGPQIALIVAGCTDPLSDNEGASWRDLKSAHIRELESAGPLVRRVALAEKLDNARALLRDYRRTGPRLWERMDVDPEDILWYMGALADLFVTERPGDMASELQDTVERLLELASQPDPVATPST